MKILFLTMVAVAAGQTTAPPTNAGGEQPPYKTGTQVVEITIAATRPGQKAVNDLTAADLKLFDNGKEQTIASFEKSAPATKPATGGQQAKAKTQVQTGSHPQRLSIIVLDALNTPWADEKLAREGVSQMLSKLPPGDRIAIFALDGSLRMLHDFSNDYESLRAAVDSYPGPQPPYLAAGWEPAPASPRESSYESPIPLQDHYLHNNYQFDESYPLNSIPPIYTKYPLDQQDPHALNQSFAYQTANGIDSPEFLKSEPGPALRNEAAGAILTFAGTNQILYTLQSLTRVAELTQAYPGPKSILWVSAGFPTEFQAYSDGLTGPEVFHVQAAKAMRELEICNAVLYPISPKGLNWPYIENMKEMADQTGGRVFYGSNDVATLVRAARDDIREGYTLTFVPKEYQADGSLHTLRIQTTRPGVALRYRTVYVANSVNSVIRPVTFSVPRSQPPVVTRVANSENGNAIIAPNSWVQIKGSNLGPEGDARVWNGSDFSDGHLPTQLDGVGVTMNDQNAYVYFISPDQMRVLAPPDLAAGPVQVKVTAGGMTSAAFTAQAQKYSPAFFVVGGGAYVMGHHSDGSPIGPDKLHPGVTTPAAPGEVVVLFANGLGPISKPVVAGSKVQVGPLPALPEIKIGGVPAAVHLAGLASPGLYQLDVVVPASAPHGDQPITATYQGYSTQTGVLIAIK